FTVSPYKSEQRQVPMVTLDHLAQTHRPPAPYLLKLDIQGYELEALGGAEGMLADTCAIVTEVSLWGDRKRRGMAEFAELVAWLRQRGFVLFDIAQIVRRDFDDAITEMDLVFLPADSPLREISAYKLADAAQVNIEKRRRDFGVA